MKKFQKSHPCTLKNEKAITHFPPTLIAHWMSKLVSNSLSMVDGKPQYRGNKKPGGNFIKKFNFLGANKKNNDTRKQRELENIFRHRPDKLNIRKQLRHQPC